MSLEVDGAWKTGVWATTVWADGVWYEGDPTPTPSVTTYAKGYIPPDPYRTKGPRTWERDATLSSRFGVQVECTVELAPTLEFSPVGIIGPTEFYLSTTVEFVPVPTLSIDIDATLTLHASVEPAAYYQAVWEDSLFFSFGIANITAYEALAKILKEHQS